MVILLVAAVMHPQQWHQEPAQQEDFVFLQFSVYKNFSSVTKIKLVYVTTVGKINSIDFQACLCLREDNI